MKKSIVLFVCALAAACVLAFPLQSSAAEEDAASDQIQAVDNTADTAAINQAAADDAADDAVTEDAPKEGIDWRHNWPIFIIMALVCYAASIAIRGEIAKKKRDQERERLQQEQLRLEQEGKEEIE